MKGGGEWEGEVVNGKIIQAIVETKADENAKDGMKGEKEEDVDATEVRNAVQKLGMVSRG